MGASASQEHEPFVHLHLHTDHSLLDGACRIDRLMARAAALHMPAVAMTDHGNLFGAVDFYTKARKAGIKPLIGCEIYLVHDHRMDERPKRERKRTDDIGDVPEGEALPPESFPKYQIHHKTIIARNEEGYRNLCKLISKAHCEGMYYRPRVDMRTLAAHAKGLIGLTGCINGVAPQYLLYSNYEKAREVTAEFVEIFDDGCYFVELQDHGLPIQRRIIPDLLKLAKEFDLKPVAANDVHYVMQSDSEPHDALLCIQTGKMVSDENRMKYPCNEFYLKSHGEMAKLFGEIPGALSHTLTVAEMVDFELKIGENHYPRYERPVEISFRADETGFDRILDIYEREKNKVLAQNGEPADYQLPDEERAQLKANGTYLYDLCKLGLRERYGVDYDNPDAYQPKDGEPADWAKTLCAQLDFELAIIVGAGFVDYFLIVWDFINWARHEGIPVGPGRGSGAGCMVAYVLKITDIEPLRFGLLFERMLSLERVSPPDFDVDFCMRQRDRVVSYVRDKYGAEAVANIITFGTFGAKMVVRDLARVLDVPFAEADRLAKMVPDDLNISLEDAVHKSLELQAELKTNAVARTIVEQGKVIEGMVRNTGKHACGIIIGDQPLTELVPLTLQEGDLTTQYPKGPVEDLGLLKMDFLGLKTLTVISDAQANVRRTTGQRDFDIEQVALDDKKTFTLLNSGQTTGVFQLESGGMQSLCRQIGLSSFEEIIALIALYRPGPMQFIPQFIEGKRDPSTVQIPHPLLRDLVEETYGVLVYQEQVMKAAQIIAGYTLGQADILRRAMGKKIASVMQAQKQTFVEGAKKTNNIDKRTAEEIFTILEKFAQYGFNKSHSAAYAMLSYRTAYLKANYPVEFMAAVLSSEQGNADKVAHFLAECGAMRVAVSGPDINASRESFTPVIEEGAGRILFGIGAIKGVGDSAAQHIIGEREANGEFQDFRDFAERVDNRTVNKRVFEALIKTGAFDALGEDRGDLLHDLDAILSEVSTRQRDKEAGQESFFDLLAPAPEPAATSNGNGRSGHGGSNGKNDAPHHPLDWMEQLQYEKELLGFYVSGHPMNRFAGLAEQLDTFRGDAYQQAEDRTPFRLCGVITGIAKKLARKDNRPWAIITLSTREFAYSVNVYSDAFEHYGKHLAPGAIVMLTGSINQRNGEAVLSAESAVPLEAKLPGLVKKLRFLVDAKQPAEQLNGFLDKLRARLLEQTGETEVQLGFVVEEQTAAIADLGASLTWRLQVDRFAELRDDAVVVGIEAEAEAPEVTPRPWERWGRG